MTAVLDVRGLRRSFGGLVVADGIDLSLHPGDRTALIGPNGAGKTTFVNLVGGVLKPHAGRIFLNGMDVTDDSEVVRVRNGLVRTFQVSRLIPDMTVRENVVLAAFVRRRRHRLFWPVGKNCSEGDEASDAIEKLGLGDVIDRPVSQIAYGQQRLVELAIAIVLQPKVLLLDEPAAGVPQAEAQHILEALDRLSPDLAIVMIEHDMDLVFRFARRVIVMAGGQIIFDGTPETVSADPGVRIAYLGTYGDVRTPS